MENNLNKVSQSVILKGEKKGTAVIQFCPSNYMKKKEKTIEARPS